MKGGKIAVLFGILVFSSAAPAQNADTGKIDEKKADVAITARVTAKELKFETVPNPKVEFPGSPAGKTEWSAERENLPESVQPGVVYRNIGITLKIVSIFPEIEKIVDEALGITPKIENEEKESVRPEPTLTGESKKKPAVSQPKNQPKN